MPETSAHWSELLTPQLSEAFYIGYGGGQGGRRQSLIQTLYGTRPSQRAFEEHLGVGQFTSKGWNFEDSGRVQYDERNKGALKRYTHAEFAKGFAVERKLVDDNLTQIAFDDAHELGDSAFRKREKGAASVFANAFSASGINDDGLPKAGPDGVALCSASHPHSADDSDTQSNVGNSALSKDAVGTTRIQMQRFTDDTGDVMDVMPDQLLVPPELEDTARTITGSVLDPTSANNAVNPQSQGRFTTVVWHYLTDVNDWFMCDSARRNRMLLWYDRIPLEFDRESDFDTLQAKFRAYMRYSYGWKDWAWIFGHQV